MLDQYSARTCGRHGDTITLLSLVNQTQPTACCTITDHLAGNCWVHEGDFWQSITPVCASYTCAGLLNSLLPRPFLKQAKIRGADPELSGFNCGHICSF